MNKQINQSKTKSFGTPISREEMKQVKGGRYMACQCAGFGTAWIGNGGSVSDIASEINSYCGSAGGSCS